MDIHILWQGPISFADALQLNGDADYGIYQLRGDHLVYGQQTLLYIGKAEGRKFGTRLADHAHEVEISLGSSALVHVGRLAGTEQPTVNRWDKWISLAEKWLIYAHSPSWNLREIGSAPKEQDEVHILNWGDRGLLLPEVSSKRWREAPDLDPFEDS